VGTRTLEVTGPLDPQAVWERYAVPARWSQWSPQISGVEMSAPRLVTGATGKVHGPLGVALPFVVDAVDEAARRWTWTVKLGLVKIRLEHWVTDGPDGGTTTGMRAHGPGPLVAVYAAPARVALGRLVRPGDDQR
jgi:Polyketide cyclase / dehydrase and lipid transport